MSWVATSAAVASRRASQSGMDAQAGPGEYRPRNPSGRRLATRPDRSPTRLPGPSGCCAVQPPRKSRGPPIRLEPPTRSAADRSASHPPFRWPASASGVTGISLSPEVVPEVFTQSRQWPGHETDFSPLAARSSQPRCWA